MFELFNNQLFDSPYWEWHIIVLTLGGILGVFALVIWMSSGERPKPGEKVKTMGHVWDGTLEELNNPLPMWWLYLFYGTMIFGLIYFLLYPGMGSFAGLLDWSEIKQYEREMEAAETRYAPIYAKYQQEQVTVLAEKEDALKIGQSLFMTYCTVCHGSDAGGGPGFPNLRDDDWLYGGEPDTIKTSIAVGRSGQMPSAKDNGLNSEQEIKNVTQYVLSLSGNETDKAAAEVGKTKFMGVCIACHGMEGKGMQALGAPNLTDNIWLYDDPRKTLLEDVTETIANGRKGLMPAHGEFLGEAKIHLLTAYLYKLSKDQPK